MEDNNNNNSKKVKSNDCKLEKDLNDYLCEFAFIVMRDKKNIKMANLV